MIPKDCWCEWVDVGVGMIKCWPNRDCEVCYPDGWIEPLTPEQEEELADSWPMTR